MISKKQFIEIINSGLSTGADYAEIFIEDKTSENISIENGKVETASIAKSYGAGIRLLNKLQSVYGYTNDITFKSLNNLAKSLAASFQGKQKLQITTLKIKSIKNKHPYLRPYEDVPTDEKINYLKRGEEIIRNYDKRIVRSRTGIAFNKHYVTLVTSKGLILKDYKQRGRAVLLAVAMDQGKIETAFNGPGALSGFEYFENEIDFEKLAKETAETAIKFLTAKECPSGRMPVVIGNGFGGVLFHEACGHSLEATAVAKKLSVFSDRLGQQIASPIVTAIDDGTIQNGWGSNNIDDEGNKTEKTVLIKNGILKSYLVDNFNGRRMNQIGNGASRRESYKYEPTSRMSNTYIDNGNSTPEEIIKATKLGLYAKSFAGGSVNPATGEFNFGCSEAYIIRDGKICEPVRGATLIGTGEEILKNIDMVGNDLKRSQGMCGSISGSIPVDVGQPTIRVSEITVGGNGGELR